MRQNRDLRLVGGGLLSLSLLYVAYRAYVTLGIVSVSVGLAIAGLALLGSVIYAMFA